MKLLKMRSESTASDLEHAADGRLTLKTLRHLRVLGDSYPGVKQESATDLRHTNAGEEQRIKHLDDRVGDVQTKRVTGYTAGTSGRD